MLLSLDGTIGRLDGGLLVFGIVVYTVVLLRRSRRETHEAAADDRTVPTEPRGRRRLVLDLLSIVAGLAMLVVGARWLVTAAVDTATALGVSELVIGLTIVAAGTSLPEVATSVLATLRGERDIVVGNVVGSNMFNLLAVLGLGSRVARGDRHVCCATTPGSDGQEGPSHARDSGVSGCSSKHFDADIRFSRD